MSDPEPAPTDILAKAATIENLITWVICARLTKDPKSYGWFMEYAADRIGVGEKIRLIGDIAGSLGDPSGVYPRLTDDLRAIFDARNRVAHAVYIASEPSGPSDPISAGYVTFKRGKPTPIPEADLQSQVADALQRVPAVSDAVVLLATKVGIPVPGSGD